VAKLATFGVKWASDESFCPSTVEKGGKLWVARQGLGKVESGVSQDAINLG